MNFTKRLIEKTLTDYENLLYIARDYVTFKFPKERSGDLRIEGGILEEYVNTSCHCHPEMSWEHRGTVEELSKWIHEKDSRPKHYTVKPG
jgi:hypothetical protein